MIKLSTDGSKTVVKPTSFGKKVELNGQYENAAIARRNADGSITIECHDEQHAAESFMQGGGHVHTKLEVQ